MWYTDDPAADYDRYCMEQDKALELLPECAECGKRIEDMECYRINGEPVCEDCIDSARVPTTYFIG